MGIQRFLKAMKNQKDSEWIDIKELTPLKFMPYMAELFQNITGRDLKGLSDFMGWVGLVAITIGSSRSRASSVPAHASKGNRCLTDP